MLAIVFNAHMLKTGISLATPVLLAALAGVLCQKVGIFNIALEGMMLIGAFAGVAGSHLFNSALAGVLLAIASAVVAALVFGLFCITFKANAIIVGFGFNMLSIGLTGWLLIPVFGGKGSFYNPMTPTLKVYRFHWLDRIPVLGPLLSGHNGLVYLSWIIVPVLYVLLYKTLAGYRMRAVGENPSSLKASGLKTDRYKYLAVGIGGALCGMGGAYLSISKLAMFTENMTAGRGFIAITAVVFSKGFIPLTAAASILFGMAHSTAIQLQGFGIAPQFVEMTPYIFTIALLLIMAVKSGRSAGKKNRKRIIPNRLKPGLKKEVSS